MPSVSKSQKRMMCMALAFKTGKLKESDLNAKYKKGIMSTARNMSEKQLDDYCHSPMRG